MIALYFGGLVITWYGIHGKPVTGHTVAEMRVDLLREWQKVEKYLQKSNRS